MGRFSRLEFLGFFCLRVAVGGWGSKIMKNCPRSLRTLPQALGLKKDVSSFNSSEKRWLHFIVEIIFQLMFRAFNAHKQTSRECRCSSSDMREAARLVHLTLVARGSASFLCKTVLIKKCALEHETLSWPTSIDVPACSECSLAVEGDAGIRDTAGQTMNFHGRIVVVRTYRCIDEHPMSSFAMQHRWLWPKLFLHLWGREMTERKERNN